MRSPDSPASVKVIPEGVGSGSGAGSIGVEVALSLPPQPVNVAQITLSNVSCLNISPPCVGANWLKSVPFIAQGPLATQTKLVEY